MYSSKADEERTRVPTGDHAAVTPSERSRVEVAGRRSFVVRALSLAAPMPLFAACGGQDAEATEALPLSAPPPSQASVSPGARSAPVTPPVPAPVAPPTVPPAPPGPLPAPKPLRGPLPSWVPAAGEVATLTQSNGLLTNTFRSTVAPYYSDFVSTNTVNAFSGSVVNPYLGTYGAIVFEGGGHADSNDNSVHVLELGANQCTFRRVTDPSRW